MASYLVVQCDDSIGSGIIGYVGSRFVCMEFVGRLLDLVTSASVGFGGNIGFSKLLPAGDW